MARDILNECESIPPPHGEDMRKEKILSYSYQCQQPHFHSKNSSTFPEPYSLLCDIGDITLQRHQRYVYTSPTHNG